MSLFDWLLPTPPARDGIRGRMVVWPIEPDTDGRSRLDKLAGVRLLPDVACGTCGAGGYGRPCKCDPDLGRPRRWFE